jgi:hypothetical protein
MLGGLLDEDERKYLSNKYYVEGHIFTPLRITNENWILPLHQIYDNTNIDCWWVKYLPIIEYKI